MAVLPRHFPTSDLEQDHLYKVESFYQRFVIDYPEEYGFGHFILAAYAAIPAAQTPDLLYRTWLNFSRYQWGEDSVRIARVAVADVLLSSLFREVETGLYEMVSPIRMAFLEWLVKETRGNNFFELSTPRDIALFLQHYIHQPNPSLRHWGQGFLEVQEWTALSYINPVAAADKLAGFVAQFERDRLSNHERLQYLDSVIKLDKRVNILFGEQSDENTELDELRRFTTVAAAMRDFIFDHTDEFLHQVKELDWLSAALLDKPKNERAIRVDITEEIVEVIEQKQIETSSEGTVFALLVGMDSVPYWSEKTTLPHAINDIAVIGDSLASLSEKKLPKVQLKKLVNERAKKEAVLDQLREIFEKAGDEDHVFLYFMTLMNRTKDDRGSIVLYGNENEGAVDLQHQELKDIIDKAPARPSVFLVLNSGRNWLNSANPKHIFVSFHSDPDAFPSGIGDRLSGEIITEQLKEADSLSYRQCYRNLLTHMQKNVSPELSPQFYAAKAAAKAGVLHENSLLRQLEDLLTELALEDQLIAIRTLNLPEDLPDLELLSKLKSHHRQQQEKETQPQPIFLFVFADPLAVLPEVSMEQAILRQLFETARPRVEPELIFLYNPDREKVEEIFCSPETRNRVQLFHFAGLAKDPRDENAGYGFVLNDGLLDYFDFLPWLDYQENIRLAYFNTCESDKMAEWMAQLSAVSCIGIRGFISDQSAIKYMQSFYTTWLRGYTTSDVCFANVLAHSEELKGDKPGGVALREPVAGEQEDFSFRYFHFPWAGSLLEKTALETKAKTGVTMYALIIGINDYPIPGHRLQGPVSDATVIHEFFAGYCAQEEITYNPVLLFNEQATLRGIVESFAHFGQARDGDYCLLYYSGHGSQQHSPPEFWKQDIGRLMGTIVCYDSRLKGGRDLTDKELFYLIWKYTKKENKNVHFLSIFDSAHIGGEMTKK